MYARINRNMSLCFTPEEWEKAITELRRICKPGGYIELVECDHDMRSIGPNLTKVMTTRKFMARNLCLLISALSPTNTSHPLSSFTPPVVRVTLNLRNISPDSASNVHTFFTNGEHVAGDYSSFPVGWNGRLGEMFLRNSELGFRTLGPYLSRAMGLSEAEWEDLAKKCLAENSEFLTWGNVHWAVGRKFSGKKVSG
ncbi:hypothetical protein BC938DRAFT_476901 [Jimgerdemannia flammicorona]|uniref:Methyltransferase type 11 domain-containing protein n=1 Tax=Jimgerdemannia flammicorona TaxID=994334 RepID=A0A433QZ10_9FUNG|nr:hypothetical protein BC938DRAFT_476901 [Jimgerdemannia flammicorona]